MITKEHYEEIKQRYDTFWSKAREWGCLKGNWWIISDEQREQLKPWSTSNEEISAMEVYEFVNTPPERYFCYIKYDREIRIADNGRPYTPRPRYYDKMTITTWIGELLGNGYFTSRLYHSNLGDERITFTVRAINGKDYYGTFFYSAGDYGRMKIKKSKEA